MESGERSCEERQWPNGVSLPRKGESWERAPSSLAPNQLGMLVTSICLGRKEAKKKPFPFVSWTLSVHYLGLDYKLSSEGGVEAELLVVVLLLLLLLLLLQVRQERRLQVLGERLHHRVGMLLLLAEVEAAVLFGFGAGVWRGGGGGGEEDGGGGDHRGRAVLV